MLRMSFLTPYQMRSKLTLNIFNFCSVPSSVGSVSYEDARDVFVEDDPVANTALACVGRDTGCPPCIQQAVPEAYLLQFGSMLGEEPCTQVRKRTDMIWQSSLGASAARERFCSLSWADIPVLNPAPW
jgi:hypothetical protein